MSCATEKKLSKGQLEDQISKSFIKFEKEQLGRGPEEARTYILGDMIVVRFKGILIPAEHQLAKSEKGKDQIKRLRNCLVEISRPLLEEIIKSHTAAMVISLHTDISTITGERVLIFTLDREIF
ncbi:MAG: hypothetical protein DDT31_01587 [Syntrophomonadaceae bacterium]|nr:hypothetical protein [Bacillota bacterium]